MYEIPSRSDVRRIVVDAECIPKPGKPRCEDAFGKEISEQVSDSFPDAA